MDTGIDDLPDFFIRRDHQLVAHKWMIHPVAAQVVDIHANFQLTNADFLDHRYSPMDRTHGSRRQGGLSGKYSHFVAVMHCLERAFSADCAGDTGRSQAAAV
jgi:hypothetical protein